MRRILSLPIAAMLCLMAATSALAAPPAHELIVSPPLEFGAGEMCAFPILLEATAERSKQTTFAVGPDGSQRLVTRGWATNRVTNLESGQSRTFMGGYRISIVFASDGSIEVDGTGVLFAFYFEGDASDLAPGMHAVNGHAHESYAADGTFLSATFTGHSTNLCETMATSAA